MVHGRVLFENGIDLSQFNPESTKLDLMIQTAEEFNVSITAKTCEVSRAVHAGSRPRTKRIRNKSFRGQLRSFEVPTRQTFAANIKFAFPT